MTTKTIEDLVDAIGEAFGVDTAGISEVQFRKACEAAAAIFAVPPKCTATRRVWVWQLVPQNGAQPESYTTLDDATKVLARQLGRDREEVAMLVWDGAVVGGILVRRVQTVEDVEV